VAGTVAGDLARVTVKVYAGSSASGTPLQTLTATRDGSGAYSTTGAALADGAYTAQAQQADSAGNTGFSSANTFTVSVPDTTPPSVTLTSPAAGSTTGASPAYSGVAGTAAGDSASVTVKVYAGSGTGGTLLQTLTATRNGSGAYSTTGAALAEGTYTALAEQADSAGNTGFSTANTFTVSVSTGGLDTTIDSGPTGTVRTGAATFTFSSNDPTAQFQCSLEGAAFVACTSPRTYHVANRGHSFQVRAVTASAGVDSTPAARSWWADALLQNGNFETPADGWRLQNFEIAGWKGYQATLSIANDGIAGSGAGLVSYQSGSDYSMFTSPKPINSTVAGTIYTANGWVRSARVGKTVCAKFREYAPSGTVVGSAQKCATTTTTSWQQFPPLPYAAVGSGNELEIYYFQVSAVAGDSFEVDGLTIVDGSSDPIPPVATGDPVLLALADVAYCYSGGDDATARLADEIAGTIAVVGDTAYNNGAAEEFVGCYNPSWGRHKDRTRPAVGDHEYGTPGAGPYWAYFGASAGVAGKGWYSYDLGAWHIVVLNSNCTQVGGCAAGSEQYAWLQADLAASTKPCTAAYFHHPRFNAGSVHSNYTTVTPFWNLLYQYGAELVLSGDEHTYQRFAPQTPSGASDPVAGIRQFVVGMGGALHYAAGKPIPNLEVVNDNTFGLLKLTLHAASYDWQFVPQVGKVFTDSGTTACH